MIWAATGRHGLSYHMCDYFSQKKMWFYHILFFLIFTKKSGVGATTYFWQHFLSNQAIFNTFYFFLLEPLSGQLFEFPIHLNLCPLNVELIKIYYSCYKKERQILYFHKTRTHLKINDLQIRGIWKDGNHMIDIWYKFNTFNWVSCKMIIIWLSAHTTAFFVFVLSENCFIKSIIPDEQLFL